jgi:hypothetical protein
LTRVSPREVLARVAEAHSGGRPASGAVLAAQAWLTSSVGLLASVDVTLDQFRIEARRVKVDATDRMASRHAG